MCPHCVLAGISAAVASISALGYLKMKVAAKKEKK